MKWSNGNTKLVDSCCVNFCENDTHVVIVDFLDTCDVCSCFACCNTSDKFCPSFAHFSFDESFDACACCFVVDTVVGKVKTVCINDCLEEVCSCCAFCQFVAPSGSCCCNVAGVCTVTHCYAVVNDFLCKFFACCPECCPECVILFLCVVFVFCKSVRTCCCDEVETCVHTCTVCFHTFDWKSK